MFFQTLSQNSESVQFYKNNNQQLTIKMRSLFKNPYLPKDKKVITFYLIGDDSANKQTFYSHLQLPLPQQSQQIGIVIKQTAQNQYLQIYDFPTDKLLRQALSLYLNILPNPSLILYFLKSDANAKQIQQWINIFKVTHLHSKIIFISDAGSYLEREKTIVRIGKEFEYTVVENICFTTLDMTSFDKLLANIESIGILINSAYCLRPTFREKVAQKWTKINNRLKRFIRRQPIKDDQKSVV